MKYILYVRKRVEVNTDPQRRCYDGVHAKSEYRWTEWEVIRSDDSLEELKITKSVFMGFNPNREYKIEEKE